MIKEVKLIAMPDGSPAMKITRETTADTMPLTNAFQIHRANEFLRSLNPNYFVVFRSCLQYRELLDLITADLKTA